MSVQVGLHSGRREEAVWSGAWGGRVAVQAVGVAGAPTFSSVTVDGSLQLNRRTQPLLLTLKWVQVLHIPTGKKIHVSRNDGRF